MLGEGGTTYVGARRRWRADSTVPCHSQLTMVETRTEHVFHRDKDVLQTFNVSLL